MFKHQFSAVGGELSVLFALLCVFITFLGDGEGKEGGVKVQLLKRGVLHFKGLFLFYFY